tara:strand:+ start:1018 stop:1623 length:606 start_codon:yes stop_codon:yes gene_type:complete
MPFFLAIPLLLMKRSYFQENFHKLVIPIAAVHIAINVLFFAINSGLTDEESDKEKVKTNNIIHASISWTAIVSYLMFAWILSKELFVGKYMIPSILMIVHAVVNSLAFFVDPSIIKIIYPIISTLVCGFITFRSWVSDKYWDGMFPSGTEKKPPAATENPPEASAETAPTENPVASTKTTEEAFGKRQRRRNPSKRRKKRK